MRLLALQRAEAPPGHSPRAPSGGAFFAQAETAEAIARPLGLEYGLGNHKTQLAAVLQVAVHSGVEHEHGHVLLAPTQERWPFREKRP